MSYKVDNAVIMAAGTSSRFAPLSYEKPKGLTVVRGEVLIERQITQLREAGIDEIIIVTGYKKEQFAYLADKFGVELVENTEYLTRNNNSSINAVKDRIRNSYICSSDNYFTINPFENVVDDAYYAAVYAHGETQEWCMTEDPEGYIDSVTIGGSNAWYMLGHTFWSEPFSRRFIEILDKTYDEPETADMLWEKIFMRNLDTLRMRIRRYEDGSIFEFDTLDELRQFDTSYVDDTRSAIIKKLAAVLNCRESDIINAAAVKHGDNAADGMRFTALDKRYEYNYDTEELKEC